MIYRAALARPVSTIIAAATLVALGSLSLSRLPLSLLPELERPRLVVRASADDRSRDEMLTGVTEPLERRLASLPMAGTVRSETTDGLSVVMVETDWDADADLLAVEATRRIDGAPTIPVTSIEVAVTAVDVTPIIEVVVLGGSGASRTDYAREVLLPELGRLDGAGRIDMLGQRPIHVVVRPRAAALAAHRVTPAELGTRLATVGRPLPAGLARDGANLRPLVVHDAVTSVDDLRDVRVATGGRSIALGDLATIALEERRDGTSFRIDGSDGALLRVYRASGANAVALARRVRARVDELRDRTPPGLELRVTTDRSGEVEAALRDLGIAALLGIGFGTVVILLFLGRPRATLALVAVVPASLIAAFCAFDLWGVSLNLISLAGLALAAGMLVDSSVVIVEAIEGASEDPDDPLDATARGTGEVAVAVVASVLTTCVAFVPLLYVGGLARAFFAEQAFAIVSSLAASTVLALTLTPVLARRTGTAITARQPLRGAYLALLTPLLSRPATVAVLTLLVTAAIIPVVRTLPRELLPSAAARSLTIAYTLPSELTIEQLHERATQLAEVVRSALTDDAIDSVRELRGLEATATLGLGQLDPHRGSITVELAAASPVDAAYEQVVRGLESVHDVELVVRRDDGAMLDALGRSADATSFEVVVAAPDEARLEALVERTVAALTETTGSAPQRTSRRLQSTWTIAWNAATLAAASSAPAAVEAQIRDALTAHQVGRVDIEHVQPEVWLESMELATLAALPIRLERDAGTSVPLSAIATIARASRTVAVVRESRRPAERLRVARAAGDAITLRGRLDAIATGAGESLRLAGEALEVERAIRQLVLAVALSLLLVYLTLAGIYESPLLPLLIMLPVPLAGIGALLTLALAGHSLSLMSLLGMLLLGGIVVNNSIVLVHRIEDHRRSGLAELEAVSRAAAERWRPILMTSATTLLGMAPLALLPGPGVVLRQALALTVLGGLTTSLAAVVFLVPVGHLMIEPLRRREKATS